MAIAATLEQPPSTPEKVWATLDRITQKQEETERRWVEFDRRWELEAEQRQAEAAKRQAEFNQRWGKLEEQFKKNSKEMGDLRNSFGEIAEHLVAPGIKERFNELGFDFGRVVANVEIIEDKKVITEADLVLESGELIMVVEIKAKPKLRDVKAHERRLERMREWHDRNNDRRRLLGAMAGAVFGGQEKKAALDAGFYVIVQSGDTMKMDLTEDFVHREW
ncbi:MAG: hypothetical protein FWD88_03140 [Treponema sp.]|nr:hypothetical protein [Treponema sp.]